MMDKVSNNTVLYNLKATESTDLIKKKIGLHSCCYILYHF